MCSLLGQAVVYSSYINAAKNQLHAHHVRVPEVDFRQQVTLMSEEAPPRSSDEIFDERSWERLDAFQRLPSI